MNHRCLSFGYVGTHNDMMNGQSQDFKVSQQGQMIYIPHIELELVFPADGISPMHLCPARYPRPDVMPSGLLLTIQRKVFCQ